MIKSDSKRFQTLCFQDSNEEEFYFNKMFRSGIIFEYKFKIQILMYFKDAVHK